LLGHFCAVHIGAYGIESDARFRIAHLGVQECVAESGGHVFERITFLLTADLFKSVGDLVEVTFERRL
jgi:hypothetical protein